MIVRAYRRSPIYVQPAEGGVGVVTPSGITSSTTITGSVGGVRQVIPSEIDVTATVTATVVKTAVITASINSTTSVTSSIDFVPGVAVGTTIVVRSYRRTPISGRVFATLAPQQKTVSPPGINSTTTISGTVVKIGLVRPATINSTTSVSGTVQKTGFLSPSQINSTTTLTGTVARSVKAEMGLIYLWDSGGFAGGVVTLTPSSISSTTTVSGSVREIVQVTPPPFPSRTMVTATLLRNVAIGQGSTINSTTTFSGLVSGGTSSGSIPLRTMMRMGA